MDCGITLTRVRQEEERIMKTDEMQNIIQDKMTDEAGTLLEIRNLKVRFTARKKVLTAVDGVSLSISPEKSWALWGNPGSGKSVMSQSNPASAGIRLGCEL